MNKYMILIMFFLPCVAMQSGTSQGELLGEKLKNAGVHEIEALLERATYNEHNDKFKTMKRERHDQIAQIKAHAMRVIARAILKKSDDMLRGTVVSDSLNESNFVQISFTDEHAVLTAGVADLDCDPALFVTSSN